MPNTCFDTDHFEIPARDAEDHTVRITVDIHPGQARIVDHLVSRARHGITDKDALLRWCICWGVYTLLGHPPNSVALMEAKINVLQDDQFEQQQHCLSISVQKYLAAGNLDAARRVVSHCQEEYRRISCGYWRERWLSTLTEPLDLLQRHGVRIRIRDGN